MLTLARSQDSPALSITCTVMPCFIPHLALIGMWFGVARLVQLRRLIAPYGSQQESYCTVCGAPDKYLLQMKNEVDFRASHGLPVIPSPTLLAAPNPLKMSTADDKEKDYR